MELIWDGKYKDGKRVAPVKLALPFQTIETVNESAQERQRMLDFFSSSRDTEWRNRLIWGDKKYVLPSLLDEFAPVTLSDVKAIARETWRRVGTGEDAPGEAGVDILGWDFAFELHEMGSQTAKDAGIDVRFRKIPREVLEKKAVDQGDIRFFELAALTVSSKQAGKKTTLELRDFIISPNDVPQEVMRAVTHWSQWIDYWAVDWDFKGDTFHNQWQAYRTKKNPKLELKATHTYETPGCYTVLVKVIDLLGNDTTKALTVEVR